MAQCISIFRAPCRSFLPGLLLGLLAVTATLSSAQEADTASGPDAAAEARKGPPPTPVRVATVVEETMSPRKKVFGELRPSRFTVVAAEEGGIVRELLVREGDVVAAGETVARLDAARLTLAIASNAASVQAARATVGEREAIRRRAERDLDLLRRASAQGGTNPRELSDAESTLAVTAAQLAQAHAEIAVIEQEGALLSRRLADLEVRAPFAGVVTKKHAEAGAWIADGGPVVDIADTMLLEGWFDVPQELFEPARALVSKLDAAGTAPAAKGDGSRDSTPLSALEIRTTLGAVVRTNRVRIVPAIDERSRTFHAIALIDNRDGRLAAGLALNAYIPEGAPRVYQLVPKDAIVYQGVSTLVYGIESGSAVMVPVTVLFPIGDRVAVTAAIPLAGRTVVVEGNERLMPGATVLATPAATPAAEVAR
jgi:RND family efflux transporter MFP subunit